MSRVRVLVGTRKGAFILTADGKRARWDVSGPHFGGWEIYHLKGSPAEPDRWPYVVSAAEGRAALDVFRTPFCLIGHSHLPAVWLLRTDGTVEHRRGPDRIGVERGERALVSVGSVGQPRDGDPSAAYAVWDVDAGTVEWCRVAYDVQEARQRIHAAGLPRLLGDRLLHGR